MKLPKELQKKSKKSVSKKRKTNKINSYILAFKAQFALLMDEFKDKKTMEDEYEINEVSDKTANKPRFAVKWDDNKIQVVIFKDVIKELNEKIGSLISDTNFIKLNQQIANHEYGHILSAETTHKLYPDEAKKYDVFELSQKQLLPMLHSPSLEKKMKQVSIDRLIYSFWEFLANYMVREKIDSNTPSDSLKSKEANILNLIQQIESKGEFTLYTTFRKENVMDKGFDRFFLLLRISDEFFVFDQWKRFCSFFNGKKIKKSLKLIRTINVLFENIIRINRSIESMKEDVIELANHLDRLNFSNITQMDVFSESDKSVVKEFIGYLKDKESKFK